MNTFEEGEIKEAYQINDINNKTKWNGTFTWKCKEQFVSKLKHSKHSQAFESKIFEIGDIKWFVIIMYIYIYIEYLFIYLSGF